jgi:hypothetical protein
MVERMTLTTLSSLLSFLVLFSFSTLNFTSGLLKYQRKLPFFKI